MNASRIVEVSPQRFPGWQERFDAANPDGPQRIQRIERFDHDPLLLLLVRRGGYAVAVVRGGTIAARKVGRRHVQSRTAAGGWSQQRFARRRTNQAQELTDAVTEHAVALLLPALVGRADAGVVLGGDRSLIREVLTDTRLRALDALATRTLYDLPDPTPAVLAGAVDRARVVRITIGDPEAPPGSVPTG